MMFRRTLTAIACTALIGLGAAGLASPAQATEAVVCTDPVNEVTLSRSALPYVFDNNAFSCNEVTVKDSTPALLNDIQITQTVSYPLDFDPPNGVNISAGARVGFEQTNYGTLIEYTGSATSGDIVVEFRRSATTRTQKFIISLSSGTPAPVITSVSPASGTDAGGTSVTIIGTDLTGATAVTFGETAATSFNVDDSTKITATTPSGTAGAVDVAVTTPGGDDTSVGAFTYTAAPAPDPTPAPANPPSAPVAPELTPGDGEVTFSWDAPATQGSFPVTNYQVQSVPGTDGCLVPATQTQCTIGSLTNGTTYEFMVRALNGGGWGPWLDAGSVTPVTPVEASIMITGSRGDVRGRPGVLATGSTFGISQGSVLHPWIRLPEHARPTEGKARITLDATGDFTWKRRTGKPIGVHICTSDRSVCSEEITIAVR